MTNTALLSNEEILESFIVGSAKFLVSEDFSTEIEADFCSLMGKRDRAVYARIYLHKFPVKIVLRTNSRHYQLLVDFVTLKGFIKGESMNDGLYLEYKLYALKEHTVITSLPFEIWKSWRSLPESHKRQCLLEVNGMLYPILDIEPSEKAYLFTLENSKKEETIVRKDREVTWGKPIIPEKVIPKAAQTSDRLKWRESGSLSDNVSPSKYVADNIRLDQIVFRLASLEQRLPEIELMVNKIQHYVEADSSRTFQKNRELFLKVDELTRIVTIFKSDYDSFILDLDEKQRNKFENLLAELDLTSKSDDITGFLT